MLQFDRFEQVRMPREKVRMRLQIRDNLALVELRRGRLFVLRIQFGHSMFPSKTVSAGPVINTGCPSPAHSIVSCPPRTCTSTWACSRSEEHTSELQSLMRISYAVFC